MDYQKYREYLIDEYERREFGILPCPYQNVSKDLPEELYNYLTKVSSTFLIKKEPYRIMKEILNRKEDGLYISEDVYISYSDNNVYDISEQRQYNSLSEYLLEHKYEEIIPEDTQEETETIELTKEETTYSEDELISYIRSEMKKEETEDNYFADIHIEYKQFIEMCFNKQYYKLLEFIVDQDYLSKYDIMTELSIQYNNIDIFKKAVCKRDMAYSEIIELIIKCDCVSMVKCAEWYFREEYHKERKQIVDKIERLEEVEINKSILESMKAYTFGTLDIIHKTLDHKSYNIYYYLLTKYNIELNMDDIRNLIEKTYNSRRKLFRALMKYIISKDYHVKYKKELDGLFYGYTMINEDKYSEMKKYLQ